MTEPASHPEFDPRYDARFQRGWKAASVESTSPAADADPETTDAVVDPEPSDAPPAAPAPVTARIGATADRAGAASDPAGGPEPAVAPRAGSASAGGVPADPTPIRETDDPGAPPAGPEPDAVLRVALGIAWGVVAVALGVGAWSVWMIVSIDPFAGPTGIRGEESARMFAYLVGPAVLTAGVLGAIVLLVVEGVRRAARIGIGDRGVLDRDAAGAGSRR
ncbi:hypothetical protein GCM10009819_11970 [Agromyces tropicus]|uniref:Uncharacterized protein n=1 Tax=Agromyces tropicus TaxID=555371 RepID=A0ABN2U758_9MICO